MSISLSFNNQTMMDYLHTDIHSKATSKRWKIGEEKENTRMLFDSSRIICGNVHVCPCVCIRVTILDASLALDLKKTVRFLPPAPSPFPPLIVASWVQADSSTCLFSLIYQAWADKCKHLPEYPPLLGALGGWMCSHFLSPYGGSMHCSHLAVFQMFSAWFSSTSTPLPKLFPSACLLTGVTMDVGQLGVAIWFLCGRAVKVFGFSVVW